MTKQYKTNMTKGFCGQWSISKCITEYTSNMLDQEDYSFEFGDDYIVFTNHNVEVSSKAILLGLSDKVDSPDKRGIHGCGYGQAMAALLAQDVVISIENGRFLWTPEFQYEEAWEEEVLVVNEQTLVTPTTHHSVTVSGLSEEDINEVKQRCLVFQDREVLFSTSIGDIVENTDDTQGEIYVADMFVCQSDDFKYSYNFKASVVTLNQDRNMVDSWELKKLTAKMISLIDDETFVKDAIEANTYDTQLVHEHYYTEKGYNEKSHAAVDAFVEEYLEENKGKLVTDDYTEHRENEESNIPSVYIDNTTKVKAIQGSDSYKEAIEDIETVEKLSPSELLEEVFGEVKGLLYRDVNTETASKINKMLDFIQDKSENWDGGDTLKFEDGLPF